MMKDPANFSRTGFTNPLGKLDEKIKEFRIASETKAELEKQAAAVGIGLAEYIRELLMVRAHGKLMVQSIYNRRLDMVTGASHESPGNPA